MTVKKRIPLLHDHHTHPSVYAAFQNSLNLSGITDKGKALAEISKRNDKINVVLGWNSSLFTFDENDLEALPPVLICNISLHGFLMNTAAKNICGKSHETIIKHIHNADWVEKNLPRVFQFIVNISCCGEKQYHDYFSYLESEGIWFAEELLYPGKAAGNALINAGYFERTKFWADLDTYLSLDAETKKTIHGLKLFTDGALGVRTAAINQVYDTGGKGVLCFSRSELHDILSRMANENKPVSIHAIGNTAIEQVIDVWSEISQTRGSQTPPARMEHAQLISKQYALKAKSLGMVLSMQPNFSYDSFQYTDRLPVEYTEGNNPFRMLIDEVGFRPGIDLILGSDGMPHGVNFALNLSLFPPIPGQKLTLEEFIAGYCVKDMKHGYIDIDIDDNNRRVSTKVTIL